MQELELKPTRLFDVLSETAKRYPSQLAYIGPEARVSWSERQKQVLVVAKAMIAMGVLPGDHVGILLGNSSSWIDLFFASACIGAVTVPVNTRFKRDELAYCLVQAHVKHLFFVDEFLGIDFAQMINDIEPAVEDVLPGNQCPKLINCVCVQPKGSGPTRLKSAFNFDDFLSLSVRVSDREFKQRVDQVQAGDPLLIQFTSGTTSYPKGVVLSHTNMLLNALAVAHRMGVVSEDRYFSIRPFFHVAGSTLSILVSLNTGCCLLTLPKFDVSQNLKILHDEKCTLISGNDTIFLSLMGHPEFDVEKLHLRGGWAAVDPMVMQLIHDKMRIFKICNAYGQSEASPNVLFSDQNEDFELRKSGFAKPLPGVSVRLANAESDLEVKAPDQGEIQVKGWNVMKAYFNKPEDTRLAFSADGWLKTGDIGESDAAGRFRMVGRLKDMFRVGGENVAPSEVEEVLHAHPFVRQAQVVGVPDARLGEVCAAFVILKPGQQASEDELVRWCAQKCANFKVPKFLAFVDSFEHIGMTGSSKIQKNKLKSYAIERFGLKV